MTAYLPELALAWSIQLMGVLSPGPGIMLILSVAMGQGRWPSLITAFGIACASIILSTATVLGLAVIFAEMAHVVTVVRYLGAAYLFWLALKAFRTAATKPKLNTLDAEPRSAWRTGLTGFVLQLSNPKAIFFWLAVASVGGVGAAPASATMLFIAGAFVISFAGHGGYALFLSSGPLRRGYLRFRAWVEATLGCFFLYAGIKLALSEPR
ncbi:LysE family translocator [Pseudooceanicola sp. MF1-13]|uniref:LysE family translocator n=1 Tax=Pseudooceanicola sp. MF1-13 TaxID=3379095 RepID=UPI003891FAA7